LIDSVAISLLWRLLASEAMHCRRGWRACAH